MTGAVCQGAVLNKRHDNHHQSATAADGAIHRQSATKLKVGVDVGGTNTDAALLDGSTVLGSFKVPTSADVMTGVREAIAGVLHTAAANPSDVTAVMVGTTHFLNALVQRKHLSRTGILRLCGPTSRALPPMVDWPTDLSQCVDGGIAFGDGGVEFNGDPITALNEAAIRDQCAIWRQSDITAFAVTSVFSLVNPAAEIEAARIISEEIATANISLSHQIGQNGLLQRESATILNASLHALGQSTVNALKAAFAELNLNAQLYLTQNDGTLMSAEYAVRYPVQTIASGPTNSMRGAAFLTGLTDAAVIDIGGTTTDIGIISAGFPRTKSEGAALAGVQTNFRVPDVLSIGLGGGSIVNTENGLSIGPESVGYQLDSLARCFAGNTLTATDLVVAMGRVELGQPALVANIDKQLLAEAQALINHRIAEIIDRMKPSAEAIPAIFVGGGSILISGNLDGVSEVIIPDHFGAANAIGAAIAQVSGETDTIVPLEKTTREKALEAAIEAARDRAEAAGARRDTLETAYIQETPLAYLPGNAVRMVVKVIGDLRP